MYQSHHLISHVASTDSVIVFGITNCLDIGGVDAAYLLTSDHVNTNIPGDCPEPSGERGIRSQFVDFRYRAKKRFLRCVFAVRLCNQFRLAQCKHSPIPLLDIQLDRLFVNARPCSGFAAQGIFVIQGDSYCLKVNCSNVGRPRPASRPDKTFEMPKRTFLPENKCLIGSDLRRHATGNMLAGSLAGDYSLSKHQRPVMRKIIVVTFVVLAIGIAAVQSRWSSAEPDSTALNLDRPAANHDLAEDQFVVHEWGTFTTFSGSDGVFMDFRPLAAEHRDLPAYVLDRGSYSVGSLFTKSRLFGKVRMETPVTYFYTDRVRTVNVKVGFPDGLLTEFYPPVKEMLPPIDSVNIFGKGELIGDSSLDWGKVDLIPMSELVPHVTDAERGSQIASDLIASLLPHGANEQHYAEARATDSALVHVHGKAGPTVPAAGFFEKFLFYRGVGKFQLPITSRFEDQQVVLQNQGTLPVRSAIFISVDGPTVKAMKLDQVDAGQSLVFGTPAAVSESELSQMVQSCLVAEGLYEKEAASMVKTWQHSWFTEQGTRVLYMVPGSTTNELLPLEISPSPQKMVRVLVGRMEIMSPEDEQKMSQAVARSSRQRAQHIAEQKAQPKPLPYTIPSEIREFGRMAEPALVRVLKITQDDAVRTEAQFLVSQFRQ